MKHFIVWLSITVMLFGCDGNTPDNNSNIYSTDSIVFNQEQRFIADQIISVFENNTPVLQYSYAKNLIDGRGITAGRAGFTTATGDLLEVIERYTALVADNPLAVYLPRLRELADSEDSSTQGLEGLEVIWQESASDERFRAVQDEVVDELYYGPAIEHAKSLGLSFPLTLLNLFDAVIQHGNGLDPDGLPAMIERTTFNVGGTPKDGIDEGLWLQEFMNIRRSVLLNPYNQETKNEWSQSVGRVDTLLVLYYSGNLSLKPPLVIDTWGDVFTIPVNLAS